MNGFSRVVSSGIHALLLIAVVALTLFPLTAAAQGVPVYKDGTKARAEAYPGDTEARNGVQNIVVNPSDSLRALAPGNAREGAWVNLTNPPQGWIYRHPSVLQNRRSPGEVPDSSATYPSVGATKWFGYFYPTTDGDSAAVVEFAIQVRGHTQNAADSLTTFVFEVNCSPDTIGTLANFSRQGVWDVDDCMENERPIIIHPHGNPRGMMIPLTFSRCASDFAADFISVRVRSLRVYNASMVPQSAAVQTSYKMDLYGYR